MVQLINKLKILVINKFSRSEFIISSREDRKRSAISHWSQISAVA